MFRHCLLCLFALIIIQPLSGQGQIQNSAFGAGEQLIYDVSYYSSLGDFSAGEARLEVRKEKFNGKPVLQITGVGESNAFFDVFYKVRDRFETRIDPSTLLPYYFIRNTREGGFVFDDTVSFDREQLLYQSSRKKGTIPPDVFDIVSSVYFMRTLSIEDFGSDSLYRMNFYLDDSVYNSVIRYEGKGFVETKWGWMACLKIKPMLILGEVFSNRFPMSVWVTDDLNHIPVLAESEIIVGSVRIELDDYSGLKNPFPKPLSRKQLKKYK